MATIKVDSVDGIGVNFCKAPKLEPRPPTFCQLQFFAYYEAVFQSVTNNKMTLNDILYVI